MHWIVRPAHRAVSRRRQALAAATPPIGVSVSSPSWTRLDADSHHLPPLVRASVHYVTTDDELDRLTAVVAGL